MSVIWKYPIDISPFSATGEQVFRMPQGAVFRHCAAQDASIALWFELPDAAADPEERWFRYFGTGYALQGDNLTYLGSALFADGALVLHVYEAATP